MKFDVFVTLNYSSPYSTLPYHMFKLHNLRKKRPYLIRRLTKTEAN